MTIIALTLSLSQVLRGDRGPCPSCPTDADHVLVRNGTYTRHVQDGRGVSVLTHTCAITYSALPYDCRPYTANTWALVLAVGWIWPQAYHWTWARCHQWLADHHIDAHQRTLERWAARWRTGAAIVIARAIQWIAALYGRTPISRSGAIGGNYGRGWCRSPAIPREAVGAYSQAIPLLFQRYTEGLSRRVCPV